MSKPPDKITRQPAPLQPWGTMEHFDDLAVSQFPAETLPNVLQCWATEESIATQTPIDLPAMLCLSVCAAALAKRVEVSVNGHWREPVNIFSVCVLEPGNRKSAVFCDATRPLVEVERELVEEAGPAVQQYQVMARSLDARQKRAEAMAAKTDDPAERQQYLDEAVALGTELGALAVVATPRLVCDDCTPERLGMLLAEHCGRMASMSAEGGVFEIMKGSYSKNGAPMIDVYLKGHSGDELRIDRVSRPPLYVRDPALTMALTVQHEVIRGLLEMPMLRGKGLLARFLYSVPESTLGTRIINPPGMITTTRDRYHDLVRTLSRIASDTDDSGQYRPHRLRLEPAALECLHSFMGELEPELGPAGKYAGIKDWASKLAGAVLRLAGVLHMNEHAYALAPWLVPIGEHTLDAAVKIGRYLTEHAIVALGMMAQSRDASDAEFIINWLVRREKGTCTKRDLYQGTKNRFQRVDDLDSPLSELSRRGMIRQLPSTDSPRAGRPSSPTIEVHPLLFRKGNRPQYAQNPSQGDHSQPHRGNYGDSGDELPDTYDEANRRFDEAVDQDADGG